jgi:hypothetical protein
MHKGNTDADTLGCPLVGMMKDTDRIYNCEPAYERLMKNIGVIVGHKDGIDIWKVKEDTTIEIVDEH